MRKKNNFKINRLIIILSISFLLSSCKLKNTEKVTLSHGLDASAGGGSAYIISTPSATYYLEKEGGGLSSMLDPEGIDWLGFHNKKGSAHKGEYRGFPNAIHKQDGSYFHAMNFKTDPSSSVVQIENEDHVQIIFTSENKQWEGTWDFYTDRCDFTMSKVSSGYNYWIQYEGVPGGKIDSTDYWIASEEKNIHPIHESFNGDLPAPEWIAFGDKNTSRVLYVLHHEDDDKPDNYVCRPDMTVFGFGRQNREKTTKHLNTIQSFSIGFTDFTSIEKTISNILN